MNRWRVGEDRGSKETDGCPLTGLATVVAGLCNGFEGPSAVNAHWNARGKCT
jgi:hypothetical protein